MLAKTASSPSTARPIAMRIRAMTQDKSSGSTTSAPADTLSRRHEPRAIPATMRAAAIDRFGPPQVLKIHTLPVPKLAPHEVLIELHAAGVGIWDAAVRKGEYSDGKEHFPLVLGVDGAGVLAAAGESIRRFRVGEEVWAYSFGNRKGGFYAEYVAVNADHVGHSPRSLTLLEAGASVCTGLTAQQGIDDHLRLRHGETILIFGASGAVGTLAVQFARRHGAHVIATATGESAQRTLRELGAEHVIDARAPGAPDRLRMFAPNGLNAILALAGGETLERCADHLLDDGRLAYPNGVEPAPRKQGGVRTIAYDAVVGPQELERLNGAVVESQLRVVITATYDLADAAKAHERLEQGHVVGRIALRIR
jgi:NADPH:quinone reductase-like Zn-dependent oxidoreductase